MTSKRDMGRTKDRRWKKTPWQRIRDAAEKGTGCRLTVADTAQLLMDGAIMTAAENFDEEEAAWRESVRAGARHD